jgi:3-isopropylmalate/(R)-2-methylmalate dehydratase small subunit
VIASTFADIFHSNAGKNGLLLVTLPEEQVQTLMARAKEIPGSQLTVSLEEERLHDDHGLSLAFSIDPFRRECLLLGLDDIGLSLKHGGALEQFEKRHDQEFWTAPKPAMRPHEQAHAN